MPTYLTPGIYVEEKSSGTKPLATATLGALTVSAISPGDWGEALRVEVAPTSQYSLLVEADSVAGDPVLLADNTDVRIGSLLWIVNEASGPVESVPTGTTVRFAANTLVNRNDGTITDFNIPNGARAYTPDFALDTTVTALTAITGISQNDVPLASITKADGNDLRPGDVVNFAVRDEVGAVTRISAAQIGTTPAMRVELDPPTTAAVTANASRIYERGFTLSVTEVNATGASDVVETHENLSLVATDRVNHVAVRLPAEEGRSFYVTASGSATTLVSRASATLAGGNDGLPATAAGAALNTLFIGDPLEGTGLHALDRVTDASILCVTHASSDTANAAISYCERRRNMIFVMDAPRTVNSVTDVVNYRNGLTATTFGAIYFPWIRIADPFTGRQISVPPSGAVAGIYAHSDAARGVHKAPAGTDVGRITVAAGTALILTKADNDTLHGADVNAIRNLTSEGIVVWGARTISADPEWVYVNVRRLFLFLEKTIEDGTQWTAFEPNDESLRNKLRRNISAFLRIQWLEGKLVGIRFSEPSGRFRQIPRWKISLCRCTASTRATVCF